jgi:hypothetical protein
VTVFSRSFMDEAAPYFSPDEFLRQTSSRGRFLAERI